MKFLISVLFLILFLPSLVFAASFSIFPESADAGTTVNFTFHFLPDTNYKVLNLSIYIPPCNRSGCSQIPYYDVDKNTISSSPDATIITSEYEGRISNITWIWGSPQEGVYLSFNATTDKPLQDRKDEWLAFYSERFSGNFKFENISNYSFVLAPLLQIVEMKIFPKEVVLNSSNPQATIYVNATIKNIKDDTHSGNSYEVNPILTTSPEWFPSPIPTPFSTNASLLKLLSDEAVLAQWKIDANYGETLSNSYEIIVNASDKNGYSSNILKDIVNVRISETQETCEKCYVKIKSCPSQVVINSKFDVSYEINATNKPYEVQAIFMNDSIKACYFRENYDECSIVTKTREITAPSTPGIYELKISCYASDSSSQSYCSYADSFETCLINVTSETSPSQLSINLQTDKTEYFKGETIRISGSVRDAKGNPVKDARVLIKLSSGIWEWNYQTSTNVLGRFNYEYPISFGDPEGEWKILVNAYDEYGNEGSAETKVRVSIPPQVYYSLRFISPLQDSLYKRGENLNIEVEVKKGESLVSNATVTCKIPAGFSIRLNETTPGIYFGTYLISFNDPLGTYSLVCQAIKEEKDKILSGGSFINIVIEPARINLKLVSPPTTTLTSEDIILFTVEATYPNGEKVKGATVTLIFQGETISLNEASSGNYTCSFKVKGEGQSVARILAKDINDNEGELETTFIIEAKFNFFSSYWWLSIFSLPIPFYFAFKYLRGRISEEVKIKNEIEKYKKEIKYLEEMQKATQLEYFQRKIDESNFKRMMEDFEKRIIECQVKIKDLETRLQQLKAKKEGKKLLK
jgi:hypothetical protein